MFRHDACSSAALKSHSRLSENYKSAAKESEAAASAAASVVAEKKDEKNY
jgi:hypothetical protein